MKKVCECIRCGKNITPKTWEALEGECGSCFEEFTRPSQIEIELLEKEMRTQSIAAKMSYFSEMN